MPRSIPSDARTVVACAMEHDPARRYATAADLARDLANLIEHRPIDARAPGWSLRLVRYAQRHPRLAAGGLTAVLLGLAASLLVLGRERDHSRALLAERNVARGLAEDLRVERDGARELSGEIQAIAASLVSEVHEAIADLPGATAARETLVARATELLESLRARGSDDPALRADLAEAHLRLGQVLVETLTERGPAAGALEHFHAARALLEDLEAPDLDSRMHYVDALLGEGKAVRSSDPERALELTREAVTSAEALSAEYPDDDFVLGLSMNARLMLAGQLEPRGPEESEDLRAGVILDGERILERSGASAPGIVSLVQALRDRATLAAYRSRTAEALDGYRAMERVVRAMVAANESSQNARQFVVESLIGQGEQLYRVARLEEAEGVLSAASIEVDRMPDPLDLALMQDRLRLGRRLGEVQMELGKAEAGVETLRATAAACEEALPPADATILSVGLLKLLSSLADAELDRGHPDAAEEALSRANDRLAAMDPLARDSTGFLNARYFVRKSEFILHEKRGDEQEQLAAARDCVALLRRMKEASPGDVSARANLAMEESALAVLEAAHGDPRDWIEVHDRCVGVLRGVHELDPARGDGIELLANVLLRRAGAHLAAGHGPEAEADYAEALGFVERLVLNPRADGYAEKARAGLAAARELVAGSRP